MVLQGADVWKKFQITDEHVIEMVKKYLGIIFGVATCTYQDSGSKNCPNSQWVNWEEKVIKNPADRSGKSADLFGMYKTPEGRREVIDRLAQLGVTTYRFSVEWSHIEPQKDKLVGENIQVYVDLCKDLRQAGIEPLVTLHHFSEPKWFHEAGSFENEENIQYFTRFAEKMVEVLGDSVQKYCTINEPAIEAMSRYVRGAFPSGPAVDQTPPNSLIGRVFALSRFILSYFVPGCLLNFNRAGNFLHGALKAHTAAYKAMKEKNPNLEVGIVHQYLKFIPTNLLLAPVTTYLTHLINDVVLNYFKTNGHFKFNMPFCHIEARDAKPETDFVGLQYYARPIIGLMGPTGAHGAAKTLMPFYEDPEGLYEAIVDTYDHFNKPIIITENGISTKDDEQRARYTRRALYAMYQAADKIGSQNLRGYYYWCLVRNLEWDMGMNPQDFGTYALNEDGSIATEPKQGMALFTRVAQTARAELEKREKKSA